MSIREKTPGTTDRSIFNILRCGLVRNGESAVLCQIFAEGRGQRCCEMRLEDHRDPLLPSPRQPCEATDKERCQRRRFRHIQIRGDPVGGDELTQLAGERISACESGVGEVKFVVDSGVFEVLVAPKDGLGRVGELNVWLDQRRISET